MRRRSGPRVEVFMGFWQTIVMKKWHCNWSDVPMMLKEVMGKGSVARMGSFADMGRVTR